MLFAHAYQTGTRKEARALNLSPRRRRAIAKAAATARWSRVSGSRTTQTALDGVVVQLTPTQEDEAMKKGTLTVKQREQQVQRLKSVVTGLYQVTGGRGKCWQAVKRVISLSLATLSATDARKVALQRQIDALVRKYSA